MAILRSPLTALVPLGMEPRHDQQSTDPAAAQTPAEPLLWSERLAATLGRFEAALMIGGAVVACAALAYLGIGWSLRYWREAAWLASISTGIATLSVGACLVWAVAVRSRLALPVIVIALAFVVLPWLYQAGVWQAIRP